MVKKKLRAKSRIAKWFLVGLILLFSLFLLNYKMSKNKLELSFDLKNENTERSLITQLAFINYKESINMENERELPNSYYSALKSFSAGERSNMFKAFCCKLLVYYYSIKQIDISDSDFISQQLEDFKRTDPTNAFPYLLSAYFYLLVSDFDKAKNDFAQIYELKNLNSYQKELENETVLYIKDITKSKVGSLEEFQLMGFVKPLRSMFYLYMFKEMKSSIGIEGINQTNGWPQEIIMDHIANLIIKDHCDLMTIRIACRYLRASDLKKMLTENDKRISDKMNMDIKERLKSVTYYENCLNYGEYKALQLRYGE